MLIFRLVSWLRIERLGCVSVREVKLLFNYAAVSGLSVFDRTAQGVDRALYFEYEGEWAEVGHA